jgi:DNA-binding IclR family transcriptional regulator
VTPIIPPAATKVLLALMAEYPTTIRVVAERVGMNPSTTYGHLQNLRADGLVEWTKGKNGTLRPTARAALLLSRKDTD